MKTSPWADRYPTFMTTPQVHEALGNVGINLLRDLARNQPSRFGIIRVGRKFLWDRDKTYAAFQKMADRYPGGRLSA